MQLKIEFPHDGVALRQSTHTIHDANTLNIGIGV